MLVLKVGKDNRLRNIINCLIDSVSNVSPLSIGLFLFVGEESVLNRPRCSRRVTNMFFTISDDHYQLSMIGDDSFICSASYDKETYKDRDPERKIFILIQITTTTENGTHERQCLGAFKHYYIRVVPNLEIYLFKNICYSGATRDYCG